MSFHPYVFFSNGSCRPAFERYQQVLGGELQIITNDDLPEGAEPMPGAEPHHVMHAALTLGDDLLMGADDPTGDAGAKKGVAVTFIAPDEQAAKQAFEGIAEGGQVDMPFAPTFWSRGFGACTDRFGVPWMIDTAEES